MACNVATSDDMSHLAIPVTSLFIDVHDTGVGGTGPSRHALPSALIAAQLLQSCWPIHPLLLGSWLDFLGARIFRFLGNADTGEPGMPPPLLSSYGSGGPTEILPSVAVAHVDLAAVADELFGQYWLRCGHVVVEGKCMPRVARGASVAMSAVAQRGVRRFWGDRAAGRLTRTFHWHTIHVCQLTSFLLFLWGLAIPLLRDPLSLLAIVGSGGTFFVGQCLLVSTLPPWRVELTVDPCRGEKVVSLPEFLEN